MKDLDWCRVISSSLKYQQHNRREVVMKAMHTLMSYCQSDFQDTEVLHNLTKLQVGVLLFLFAVWKCKRALMHCLRLATYVCIDVD